MASRPCSSSNQSGDDSYADADCVRSVLQKSGCFIIGGSSSSSSVAPSATPKARRRTAKSEDDANARVRQLEKEKADLQQRLDFVEELIGPTEAQRKTMQEQLLAARSAAVRAKYRGAGVPIKVAGRLDERLLWESGLSERDAGLLQGGCLPDKDGILQDVSMLGDPAFRPYDESTGKPRWKAKGGMLHLSLEEVKTRFGDVVARDVLRCAQELDTYDASRRVGIELPWHPVEDRELQPSEVIELLDRELNLQTHILCGSANGAPSSSRTRSTVPDDLEHDPGGPAYNAATATAAAALVDMGGLGPSPSPSPYAVVNAPPRRGRTGAGARRREEARVSRQRNGSVGVSASSGSAVVALPRVDAARRMVDATTTSCRPSGASRPLGGARCAGIPGRDLRPRIQDPLDNQMMGCNIDRRRVF